MVDFLSNWIEGIAIAVILVSIFEMLLPEGNTKKYIKIILGIYVVFSIISPFVDSEALYKLNISDTIEDYASNTNSTIASQDNSENNLDQMYIDTFETELKNKIEEQGYNVKTCTVDAVFDTESEDFGITNITIVLDSKNNNDNSEKNENKTNTNQISEIQDVEKVEINIGNTQEQTTSNKEITSDDVKDLKKYLSDYYEIDKSIINIQT